jgi:hypothetical protein
LAQLHLSNTANLTTVMPEPFVSGYYPPGTNNTAGFSVSYPNFNQPAQWSTGTNSQPPHAQNFEQHAANFGYGDLNVPPQGTAEQSQQYVAADHLFSQNNSAYQNSFSAAPYLNGGMGNWSYFNNPNSFFFPTGNGDLNLNWGAPAGTENHAAANAAFLQDIYKPPPPPQEQEKIKVEPVANQVELNHVGFEANGEVSTNETVEHALSNLSVVSNENLEPQEAPQVQNQVDAPLQQQAQPPQQQPPQQQQPQVVPPAAVAVTTKPQVAEPTPAPPISTGPSNAPAKPVSWAAVASQPAKSKPPPKKPAPKPSAPTSSPGGFGKPNFTMQNGSYREGGKGGAYGKQQQNNNQGQQPGRWARQGGNNNSNDNTVARDNDSHLDINSLKDPSPLLKKLMAKYNFNPREFSMNFNSCRFFIIKSYSEDDIFRSIKYSSWTSTEHGNRRLNECYREQAKIKGPMYLLFSVNSSGHFCGVAEMKSEVDLNVETGLFVQDKWKGRFDVRWIYVKDVPNNSLRHIRLENNENKPVTNSRDTQEVPHDKGKQIMKIIHNYKAQTSIFDDFSHYEKRQEEDAKMKSKKMPEPDL